MHKSIAIVRQAWRMNLAGIQLELERITGRRPSLKTLHLEMSDSDVHRDNFVKRFEDKFTATARVNPKGARIMREHVVAFMDAQLTHEPADETLAELAITARHEMGDVTDALLTGQPPEVILKEATEAGEAIKRVTGKLHLSLATGARIAAGEPPIAKVRVA